MKRDPIPGAEYSEFDRMKLERLPNWGAWGRHDPDRPDADRLGSPIADRMTRDERELEDDYVPEPIPVPIDHADAERLDMWIRNLGKDHRGLIIRAFYKRESVYWMHLDAAIRALMDLMDRGRVFVVRYKP